MTIDNSTSEGQEALRQFVNREVFYCVSTLVYEIAQQYEHFPDYEEDLLNAYSSEPDYEECLLQNNCEAFTDEYGTHCWRDTRDGMTWAGSAQEACEAFEIDADDYRCEIFEHWIVSDWLADRLEEQGERVLRDFFGLTVWGRTTTGQAILLDSVISTIYNQMLKAA